MLKFKQGAPKSGLYFTACVYKNRSHFLLVFDHEQWRRQIGAS